MKIRWLDRFLADEERASKIIINGAGAVAAVLFVLAVAAIVFMK